MLDDISLQYLFTALNEIADKVKGTIISLEEPGVASALESSGFADFIKLVPKSKDAIYSDWPKQRAIFLSEDQTICILVNGRNHIKIYSKIQENNLSTAYAKLVEVHNALAEKISFSFDSKYGYYTSDIPQIGSGGLFIEVHKFLESAPEDSISKSEFRNIVSIKTTSTLSKYKAQALYGTGIKEISECLMEYLKSSKQHFYLI